MANEEHLKILKQGVKAWNEWRGENPDIEPDLEKADLDGVKMGDVVISPEQNRIFDEINGVYLSNSNLTGASFIDAHLIKANFSGAKLRRTDFTEAFLFKANFCHADLEGADLKNAVLLDADLKNAKLQGADFSEAVICNADLTNVDLKRAILYGADLRGANLKGAHLDGAHLGASRLDGTDFTGATLTNASLERALLVNTKLNFADLSGCRIFGISAWRLELEGANQTNLIITPRDEVVITVDNLEVAQFIYLLLNNKKIRDVIDTITTKVVLILGRFTKPRKAVLEAIRNELRQHDYLPVLFDFDKLTSRDIHETVGTLARMARFVIADITNPRSIPQELVSIVEQLPSLPVQPLLKHGSKPWGMYGHIKRYPWVLEIHRYRNLKALHSSLRHRVIAPAEDKFVELNKKG